MRLIAWICYSTLIAAAIWVLLQIVRDEPPQHLKDDDLWL